MRMDGEEAHLKMLATIHQNIAKHGHHTYVVSGGPDPRFAYTIGLTPKLGMELVIAGSIWYLYKDVIEIINGLASRMALQPESLAEVHELSPYGVFTLRGVDQSWTELLLRGTIDYYKTRAIKALQIVPDPEHWTIDVPDLSRPFSPTTAPNWRWLEQAWTYTIPPTSKAITNLDALRGSPVTEAMRWEDNEWELFSGPGPDVKKEDMRVVPIATLLASDPTLEPVINLSEGHGLWREPGEDWQPWGEAPN